MPELTIDGVQYHYILNRASPEHGGKRVIYVHGTGCNGQVFARHINALDKHQAAALDLSGHGQSGGKGYCGVVDHAYIVAEFIRALGWEPCVLAGHSLGGGIVIALAIYFPELVEKLILVDTGARLRVAPAVIENAKRIASGDSVSKDTRQGFSDATSQSKVDALREITANEDPAITLKDWYADDSCDFLSRVAAITVPTLAICGREDRLTPLKYHQYLREHMPECELHVIENAGHWPFVEQPHDFDSIVLKFLSKNN